MARLKLIPVLLLICYPVIFHNVFADIPFQTHTVQYESLSKEILLDGVVEAVNRSTVSSETSGRIMEINFDIGDRVKAGSVLVRVTKAEQQSQFAAAEAQQVEAEARLKEAENEYERIKGVFEKKLVAKSALDKATADLKAAKQRLQGAKAKAKQAKEQLRYTLIKAPYTGVVVERHVELGELVAPGKPVMTGLSLKNLRVAAQVPQSLISQIHATLYVDLIFPQLQGQTVLSEHLQMSPQADAMSHTFLVRAYLPENTPNVYPGMFSKLVIDAGEKKVLLVPEQAIVHRSELTAAYVVKDNKVQLRQLRIGHRQGKYVEVLAGLDAGEQVALDPIQAGIYLKEQRNNQTAASEK